MSWAEANDVLGVEVAISDWARIEGEIVVMAANKVSLRFPTDVAPVFALDSAVELRFLDRLTKRNFELDARVSRRLEFEDRRQYEFMLLRPDALWRHLGTESLLLVNLQPNSRAQPCRSEPVVVSLEAESQHIELRGELSDISVAGMAVNLDRESVEAAADELANVDLVKISMRLPPGDDPLLAWAHIRRRSITEVGFRYGLVFDTDRTDGLAQIQARIGSYVMARRREDAETTMPRRGARTIQSRISRAMWLVASGFILLAGLTAWYLGDRFANEHIARSLHDSEVQLGDQIAVQRAYLRRSAQTLVADFHLESLLLAPRPDHLAAREIARAARSRTGAALVVITDRSGRILANSEYPGTTRQPFRTKHGVWEDHDALFSVAVVPVRVGGTRVGSVVLGEKLDTVFASSIRKLTKTDVLIVLHGHALAGSWSADAVRPVNEDEIASLSSRRESHDYDRVSLCGRESFATIVSLGDGAMIVLSLSAADVMAMYWMMMLWLVGTVVIVSALSFWLSRFIAAKLSRPIRELTQVSCELADGNLDVSVRETGTKELAVLAGSFNRMAERIQTLLVDVRKQAQLVEEQRAELEVTNAKDGFLVTVSHELLTPLTNILSSAEILSMLDDADRGAEEEFLAIIQHQSVRLRDLIHQLLLLARIRSGNGQWVLEDFDLAETLRSAAGAAPGHVRLELPGGACRYRGDARRLKLAIDSLIDNGRKFSADQCVTVRLLRNDNDNGYELRFADCGPGVPDADKSRIFEKFVQLGDLLTDRPSGTGLGLAICDEIVSAHAGTVRCEDNEFQGAVFVVVLPDYDAELLRPVDQFARKAMVRVG